MTTLGLSDHQDLPESLLGRIKWSIVVPWLVTALLFGTNGYHRFLASEEARVNDSREIQQLRREMAEQNVRISQMQSEMAVMKAILERVEQRGRR